MAWNGNSIEERGGGMRQVQLIQMVVSKSIYSCHRLSYFGYWCMIIHFKKIFAIVYN